MLRSVGWLPVVGVVVVCLGLAPTTSSAQMCAPDDIRCQNVPVTWRGEARLFDDIGFDTGFIPRNSPVSIRAAFGLLSRSAANMTGMLRADWPSALTVHLTGDQGMGNLSIDFGLVFEVQLKLDIDVGIASINRTFDIPVGLPTDLAFRGSKAFAPLLLPGQAGRPVSLVTNTSRIRVANFSVPVIAGLSVGGGLDIRGTMTTRYQTDNMLVDGVTVLAESQGTLVGPVNAAAGFGAFQDIPTRPVGSFEYAVGIELIPVITVEFFTFQIASIDISSFALQAFESDGPAVFTTVPAHVPLPDVRFTSTRFDFPETELGGTSVLRATVRNFGEATLYVDMTTLPEPFTSEFDQLVIEPGGFARTAITFAPTVPGPVMALAEVETNDPDAPTVTLDLRATVPFPPMPDLGVAMDADVQPDGAVVSPDGAVVSPDGSVMVDGAVVIPDGAVVLPDGAILMPDGAVFVPNDGTLSGGACGCRVPASHSGSGGVPLGVACLLVFGLLVRRRRR
ncbi:MAG: hypothetical protein KC668_22140 [Myxococcales bacterium]|nr:hypothetical protein [Myxococcales bacterium]